MSDSLTRARAVADQHPGEVGVVGETVNDYGTTVAVLRCATCGNVVTVCPPPSEHWGDDCLSEQCGSYDLSRDIDIFWDAMSEHGLIERAPSDSKDSDDG